MSHEELRERTRERLSLLLSLTVLRMHADENELDKFIDAMLAELKARL